MAAAKFIYKGGAGSGNFGHYGRPGKVGGSGGKSGAGGGIGGSGAGGVNAMSSLARNTSSEKLLQLVDELVKKLDKTPAEQEVLEAAVAEAVSRGLTVADLP